MNIYKYFKLICFFCFFAMYVSGQTQFYKSYYAFYGSSSPKIVQLPDSGYILYSQNNYIINNYNQSVRRLDKYGNVLWNKEFATATALDQVGDIILTSNDQIVISGNFNLAGNVCRMDLNGNIIFHKTIGSLTYPEKSNIIENSAKDLFILNADVLTKLDSAGNKIWSKKYDVYGMILNSIHNISANKIIMTGHGYNLISIPSSDLFQLCIDTAGNVQYSKAYGTPFLTSPYKSERNSSGNIYHFFDYQGAENDNGVGVLCTDVLGNKLWAKILDGYYIGAINSTVLKDNSLLFQVAKQVGTNYIPHLIHMMPNGQIVSNRYFPVSANFSAANPGMCATKDGGFILANFDNSSSTYGLLKVGPSLQSSCKTMSATTFSQKFIVFDELTTNNTSITGLTTVLNSSITLSAFSNTTIGTCSVNCNTSASFISPASSCINSGITFTNNSQNFSANVWRINGVNVGTANNLTYNFTTAGNHTVSLKVNGACVDSMVQQIYIDVLPAPNFTLTKSDLAVRFIPYQIPNNVQLTWSFGDGYINNISDTVWHNYDEIGTYTVCLKATNKCGVTQLCKTVLLEADVSYNFYKRYKNFPATNGYQSGTCIDQAPDGGYFVGGVDDSYGPSGSDGLISRFDTAGHHLWTRIIDMGSASQQNIEHITATRDGGALFSGSLYSPGNTHAFGRIDSTGYAWHNSMFVGSNSDNLGNNMELKGGRSIYSGSRNGQGYLIVFNKNGSVFFYREYLNFINILSIRRSPDNNFYVFGNTFGADVALMKLDSSFNIVWTKSIDLGNYAAYAKDMQISASGKIFMTGQIYNANSTKDTFIACVDLMGNSIWTKKYVNDGFVLSLVVDKNCNVYVSSPSSSLRHILKTDSLGNILMSKNLNMLNSKIVHTHDDGIAIIASSSINLQASNYNFAIIKADKDSLPPCSGTSFTISSSIASITITSLGNFFSNVSPTLTLNYCNENIYVENDSLICISSSVLTPSFNCINPCVGGPVNFNNLSVGPVMNQQWTFSGATPSTSTLQNPSVSFTNTGTYTVNLTVNGTHSYSQAVTIFPAATITISPVSATVCSGNTIALNAIGAVSYTWNGSQTGASIIVSPTASVNYTAVATNSNGCSATATNNIFVHQLPNISASANQQLICIGQSATLTASGGVTYTWNPGGIGQSIVVAPASTSIYTLSTTDINNCLNSTVITISVSVCTGENNISTIASIDEAIIYPNPFDNTIFVECDHGQNIEVINSLGIILYSTIALEKKNYIDMKNYPKGLYYVRLGSQAKKMIKQ